MPVEHRLVVRSTISAILIRVLLLLFEIGGPAAQPDDRWDVDLLGGAAYLRHAKARVRFIGQVLLLLHSTQIQWIHHDHLLLLVLKGLILFDQGRHVDRSLLRFEIGCFAHATSLGHYVGVTLAYTGSVCSITTILILLDNLLGHPSTLMLV